MKYLLGYNYLLSSSKEINYNNVKIKGVCIGVEFSVFDNNGKIFPKKNKELKLNDGKNCGIYYPNNLIDVSYNQINGYLIQPDMELISNVCKYNNIKRINYEVKRFSLFPSNYYENEDVTLIPTTEKNVIDILKHNSELFSNENNLVAKAPVVYYC